MTNKYCECRHDIPVCECVFNCNSLSESICTATVSETTPSAPPTSHVIERDEPTPSPSPTDVPVAVETAGRFKNELT